MLILILHLLIQPHSFCFAVFLQIQGILLKASPMMLPKCLATVGGTLPWADADDSPKFLQGLGHLIHLCQTVDIDPQLRGALRGAVGAKAESPNDAAIKRVLEEMMSTMIPSGKKLYLPFLSTSHIANVVVLDSSGVMILLHGECGSHSALILFGPQEAVRQLGGWP